MFTERKTHGLLLMSLAGMFPFSWRVAFDIQRTGSGCEFREGEIWHLVTTPRTHTTSEVASGMLVAQTSHCTYPLWLFEYKDNLHRLIYRNAGPPVSEQTV